jgi:hypothetical protein
MLHFIYFLTNISTEYFKHAAHSPFFSSKCRLFHNFYIFWFLYYSHFTYRLRQNLNVKLRCQKANQVHKFPSYFLKIYFIIILLSMLRSSKSPKSCVQLFSPTHRMSCPYPYLWFIYLNNIWWGAWVLKLFNTYFSPFSCYFLLLGFKSLKPYPANVEYTLSSY